MRRIFLVFVTVLTVAGFAAAESPANADGKARAITTAIDNALDADWAARSITPAVVATDAEFARRLYLDLIGRIPTVSEVRFFEDDKTAGKRARLVDKLLKKPGYATQMARVLRAAWLPETLTDINVQFLGLQYETWLRKQLIAKTPLDKIVHKTLTAKLQVGGRRNFRGASSEEPEDDDAPIQSFYDAAQSKPENLGSTVTRAFLGVKLECAQCHDHPFASYTREQFWEFAAFFGELNPLPRIRPSFVGPNLPQAEFNTLTIPSSAKIVTATFFDGTAPKWNESRTPRTELADWITHERNPYFARNMANRLWQQFFGIGLIDPVDELSEGNPASHPELLTELAKGLQAAEYDLQIVIRGIVASRAYQLSSKQSHASQTEPRRLARMNSKGLTANQIFDSFVTATGLKLTAGRNVANAQAGRINFRVLFPDSARPTETQTSILQALMLMNGKLMADQTSLDKSETLAAIADAPFFDTDQKVEALFYTALTRKPTPEEREKFTSYVDRGGPTGDASKALGDVFWVLLNSTEFLFNH